MGRKFFKYSRRYRPTMRKMPRNLITSDRVMVKLKYLDLRVVDVTANSEDFIIRGNSAFDPQFSLGGGQPLGFDQWGDLYTDYIVHGSKVRFSITPASDNISNSVMALFASSSSGVPAPQNSLNQPYSKWKPVVSTQNSGNQVATLKMYMSTAKIFGLPKSRRSDQEFSAAVTGNPSVEWYWHLLIYNYANSVQRINYSEAITVTYYVEFFNRRRISDA